MTALLVTVLLLGGAGFVLVAAIGLRRLPDTLCRMHAVTKAGAFGAALLVAALVLQTGEVATAIKGGLVVAAFYVTAPIAGHVLGRAIYRRQRTTLHLTVDEWHRASSRPIPSASDCSSTQKST